MCNHFAENPLETISLSIHCSRQFCCHCPVAICLIAPTIGAASRAVLLLILFNSWSSAGQQCACWRIKFVNQNMINGMKHARSGHTGHLRLKVLHKDDEETNQRRRKKQLKKTEKPTWNKNRPLALLSSLLCIYYYYNSCRCCCHHDETLRDTLHMNLLNN